MYQGYDLGFDKEKTKILESRGEKWNEEVISRGKKLLQVDCLHCLLSTIWLDGRNTTDSKHIIPKAKKESLHDEKVSPMFNEGSTKNVESLCVNICAN
jgi:hypothetical protein